DKPIFLYGLLDQGYWPDGLYTPPTDDALIYDIKMAKDMGFNTLRKHIKVELARWYYHCDRLGMIVWQDTPSGGSVKVGAVAPVLFFGKFNIEWGRHKKEVQEGFFQTLREMIEALYNHPSILIWDIFNEGWGQFKTKKAYEFVKNLEKNRTGNRLIDVVSGWVDKGIGDIHDIHKYPGPGIPERKDNRALINGEFGGLGLSITGHLWPIKFKFQYRKLNSKEELFNRYATLIEKLKQLKTQGLSGAIYTELTDVEGEVNGLITYDRKILKIEPDKLKKLHKDITF
ncbi:MAG: glycoside hydrolase family 2 TIM barrel-domain containing protein, partial [Promethearchaeota archaeon]